MSTRDQNMILDLSTDAAFCENHLPNHPIFITMHSAVLFSLPLIFHPTAKEPILTSIHKGGQRHRSGQKCFCLAFSALSLHIFGGILNRKASWLNSLIFPFPFYSFSQQGVPNQSRGYATYSTDVLADGFQIPKKQNQLNSIADENLKPSCLFQRSNGPGKTSGHSNNPQ